MVELFDSKDTLLNVGTVVSEIHVNGVVALLVMFVSLASLNLPASTVIVQVPSPVGVKVAV